MYTVNHTFISDEGTKMTTPDALKLALGSNVPHLRALMLQCSYSELLAACSAVKSKFEGEYVFTDELVLFRRSPTNVFVKKRDVQDDFVSVTDSEILQALADDHQVRLTQVEWFHFSEEFHYQLKLIVGKD